MYIPNIQKITIIRGGGVILLLVVYMSIVAYKFVNHEKIQNDRIQSLESNLASIIASEKAKEFNAELMFQEDNYNYLAIGNSITKHFINEYWWNEIGMAASSEDKDFVHRVAAGIQTRIDEEVTVFAMNYGVWELQYADRAETYVILDPYLSDKLNLITIQLGENITDATTLGEDFHELIRHIQLKCPKAKIVLVGQFWPNEKVDTIKQQVCEDLGLIYVNLKQIQGISKYMAGMNAKVYDKENNVHIIEHKGVAAHPGDLGMEWIANSILENIISNTPRDAWTRSR